MKRHFLILIASSFLIGCQNPWKEFYQGMSLPPEAPENALPQCIPVADFDSKIKEFAREGYVPFGQSAFNAGNNVSLDDLQNFGATLKADVILYAVGNRTMTQSAMALPQYHPGTETSTYVSGYGSNGNSFYGTAKSYSSGTYSTTVVPVTIVRQDYAAVYLKRNWTKPVLGVFTTPVSAEQAKVIGTNSALLIRTVIRNTPAFHSDLYEGDCILELNTKRIPPDHEGFVELLHHNRGKEVELLIYRDGTKTIKKVQLAPGY
jgi:hypothetical protein